MPQTQITVEDLNLAETSHVEKALEAVAGVHSATAEAGARRVVVHHEESLSREALLAAIKQEGSIRAPLRLSRTCATGNEALPRPEPAKSFQ